MSATIKERQEARQADFKRGIDGDDARRGRDEGLLSIRKNKREDKLAKRRGPVVAESGPNAVPGAAAALMTASAPQDMQNWVAKLHGNTYEDVFAATVHFRKILSLEKNPPIQSVIDANIVPQLVKLCTAVQHPKLQYEAAWALTNIASGTSQQTKAVLDAGALPVFSHLLISPDEMVREQAIWALGNIAGDSPACRDAVLQAGALPNLIKNLAHTTKLSMLRNGTWTMSNFARGKPQPDFAMVKDALPALAHLIKSADEEVLTDACWALSYLSDGSAERISAVVGAGVLPRLVELLNHANVSIQTPALRTIGNVATGDEKQTDAVIRAGAVPMLVNLVGSQRKGIRKEAVWTLSNITAGTVAQIQSVIDSNGLPEIIRQLDAGEWEVKKEAAWAVSNYLSGATAQQVRTLVSKKVIKPLCNMLDCKEQRMITVCLEALRHILKHGQNEAQSGRSGSSNAYADLVEDADGLDKIEQLQEHASVKVYELAVDIIEKYFSEDAGESENFGSGPAFFGAQQQPFGKADVGAPQPFSFGGGGGAPVQPFAFQPQQQAAPFSFGMPAGGGGGFSF